MTNSETSRQRHIAAGPSESRLPDHPDADRGEFNGQRPFWLLIHLQVLQAAIRDALLALGAALIDEAGHRLRELVALRVSAVRNNEYVWNGHVAISQYVGALDRTEIARVAFGPTAFGGRDAAVLWAVDHILANRPIDAATAATLGERDVRIVSVATGFFSAIASIMQGVAPEPGVPQTAGIETPARARGSYADSLS